MKNTHIEHPEDSILTGDLSVLDWFCSMKGAKASLKIDGSPAIVWGTNPATGNFFVGTKSVFNKKKLKINESHEDIDRNHPDKDLSKKLHACFDCLPNNNDIVQGDFIGFGGDSTYQPNTLVYSFPETIYHNIIVAPHTVYDCPSGKLSEAVASSLDYDLPQCSTALFVKPNVKFGVTTTIIERCKFARQMAQLVTFPDDDKTVRITKKNLNHCIRQGINIGYDNNLISLWKLVRSIKHDFMNMFEHDAEFTTFLYDGDTIKQTDGEGYVMWNSIGTYKLVDRDVFSYINFNQSQFRRE